MSRLQSRLDDILKDRQSGSRQIAEALARAWQSPDLPEPFDRAQFVALARRVQAAAPVFALVHDFLHTIGSESFAAPQAAAAHADRLRAAAARWHTRWRRAGLDVTRHAITGVAQAGSVVTVSNSGAVHDLLMALRAVNRTLRVLCAVSHPGDEGALLCRAAAAAGHHAELVEDEDLPGRLKSDSVVVTGADAVGPSWFINKVGTERLIAAAGERGLPVIVLAESAKWAPPSRLEAMARALDSAPAGEGAAEAARLFEIVPLKDYVTMTCEQGTAAPADIVAAIAHKPRFAPIGP